MEPLPSTWQPVSVTLPPHTHTHTLSHAHTAQGNVDILKFFVERLEDPGDINIQDNIQATPAHDAAEFGQTQAMIVLLKAGADLNIQDYVSATPPFSVRV